MNDSSNNARESEAAVNTPLRGNSEAQADRDEPFPGNGASHGESGKVCSSCQSENPVDADGCWKCGRVLAGEQADGQALPVREGQAARRDHEFLTSYSTACCPTRADRMR